MNPGGHDRPYQEAAGGGAPQQGCRKLLTPSPEKERRSQSAEGRLGALLCRARWAILGAQPGEALIPFQVRISKEELTLWARVDTSRGLAIHILRSGEC